MSDITAQIEELLRLSQLEDSVAGDLNPQLANKKFRDARAKLTASPMWNCLPAPVAPGCLPTPIGVAVTSSDRS